MHTPTHSTDAPFPRPPCSTSQQGSGGARTLTHSPTRDRRTPAAHEAHAHGTKCMRDLGQTVRALAARMQTWQWHMPAALHPYDVTRHILFNRAMCSVSHHMRDGGGRALLVAHGPSLRPASSRSIRVSKHERSVLILLDGYEETQWAPANVAAACAAGRVLAKSMPADFHLRHITCALQVLVGVSRPAASNMVANISHLQERHRPRRQAMVTCCTPTRDRRTPKTDIGHRKTPSSARVSIAHTSTKRQQSVRGPRSAGLQLVAR